MRKKIFHVALAVGAVTIVGTALTLAFGGADGASDASEDRYLDHDWESKDRDLAFESDRDRWFAFESTRDVDGSHDVVRGRFDLQNPDGDEPTYRLGFERNPRPGVEDIAPASNDSWLAMDLRFVEFVEYHDNSSDGRFTPAADAIVDRVKLADVGDTQLRVDEPVPGRRDVTATIAIPPRGTLEIDFLVTSSAFTVGERTHRPTVTDLEVTLQDYPFEEEGADVALHSKVTAPAPLEFDADEDGVELKDPDRERDFVGRYTWGTDLVGVNGTMDPVVIEAPHDASGSGSEATLLFSYPRSDHVEHAMAMGVHHERPVSDQVLGFLGNWFVFGVALVGSVLILAGSMYAKVKNEDPGPPYA